MSPNTLSPTQYIHSHQLRTSLGEGQFKGPWVQGDSEPCNEDSSEGCSQLNKGGGVDVFKLPLDKWIEMITPFGGDKELMHEEQERYLYTKPQDLVGIIGNECY